MQPRYTKSKKRVAAQPTKPNKRPRLADVHIARKEKASQKEVIPIPEIEGDIEISDEDIEFFQENERAGRFLQQIDPNAIGRSKKETERIFELSKAPYRTKSTSHSIADDFSASSSDDWSSGVEGVDSNVEDESEDVTVSSSPDGNDSNLLHDSEDEQPYERKPRKLHPADLDDMTNKEFISRLPIKLSNGKIQHIGARRRSPEGGMSSEDDHALPVSEAPKRNIGGTRFGRASIVDIVSMPSRAERIQAAREQIASICQDILSEPESNLGLLKRLLAFAAENIELEDGTGSKRISNDTTIRQLAIISMMAVLRDIAPGYRIRKLSEKELSEKVSQMVGQTREWEQGLVATYQLYLQLLEKEVIGKTTLRENCLQCMCTLLTQLTHFNFRTNIMSTLIANISRKTWDASSESCLNALITVFKDDRAGLPSLEAVRLLNRMIKERKYNVNPRVLTCLLHLRLKNELKGVRASKERADRRLSEIKAKTKRAKGKGKNLESPHLSKKTKKALKETKQIKAEMEEAEATVDGEERATQQTETLKLLFVLYFSILKGAPTSPLLSAALIGIARFAHLINVEFFRDLLSVIQDIMVKISESEDESEASAMMEPIEMIKLQILCIVTAFELLTGQGEALDLDLSHFTSHLYRILPQMAAVLFVGRKNQHKGHDFAYDSEATDLEDLLFRALSLTLAPKYGKVSSHVLAAFSKRLLSLATQTPPSTTVKLLRFVQNLLGRDSKLDALLSTDERIANGFYRDDVDDPQLCNPFAAVWWEVLALEGEHYDKEVRGAAHELRTWNPS